MPSLRGIALRLRALLRRSAAERDLDDEIRLHIELETAKNIKLGMSKGEARRAAMRDFGGVEVTKEAHRDGRGTRTLEELAADVKFALRTMSRAPAITGAAIITLALGIGANTAIFSAVDAVILRPLPFAAPNRLVTLWEENPDRGWRQAQVAPANFFDWAEQVQSFESAAAYVDFKSNTTLTGYGEPKLLVAASVTGTFFSVLGVTPELGRSFRADETWEHGTHVAMITHRLWVEQFGGRRDIVGKTIVLRGNPRQLVGILPASFDYPGLDADVWTPTEFGKNDRAQIFFRRAHWLRGIARLKPGVSLERANAELQAVVRRLQEQYPQTNTHMGAGMTPLHDFLIGDTRKPLLTLLAAVALLLLLACANVANLLLVQTASREREFAVRIALGARRARLVRQALTESLLLSVLGGTAGLLVGWWGTSALVTLQPASMLPVHDVHVSRAVLAYVTAIVTLNGLIFGIGPALWHGSQRPSVALKEGGRSETGGRRIHRWGGALVVAEVAIAVVLCLGAGLLARSVWRLRAVDAGFDAKGVMTAEIDLPGVRYDSAVKISAFFDELQRRARAIPGVQAAAIVSGLPTNDNVWSSDFAIDGRGDLGAQEDIVHREISPGYTAVMRVKLERGRLFTDADRAGSAPVVLINEALATKYFAGEDPIGKRVCFDRVPDARSTWRTIVGVVSNERQRALAADARPEFLSPPGQELSTSMTLVARTSSDPVSLAPAFRGIVGELDPNLAIAHMRPMEDVRAESMARERFLAALVLVFAIVGLTLAAVGVYGVIAQLARGRTREMGIRVALGARAHQVQWLVVRQGLALAIAGVGIGLAVATSGARLMSTMLYHIAPTDLPTFVVVPGVLIAAALVATWIPAWRASRVDPIETLRSE
jgi:putative ABC transport system permease protein